MTSFEPPGADTQQAFVFNRRPDGAVRVFSDFVEVPPGRGFVRVAPERRARPARRARRQRLQGLPRGGRSPRARPRRERSWTTLRLGGLSAASLGCVPAAQWVGSRLANPYKHKFAAEGSLFEAPITVPWPPAAYNVGQGRCSVLHLAVPANVGAAPTLGGFVGAGMLASAAGTEGAVTKETALDCVRALRAAGWQPPPQLVAVEVAAEAAIAAAAVAAAAANGAAGDAKGAETRGGGPRGRRRAGGGARGVGAGDGRRRRTRSRARIPRAGCRPARPADAARRSPPPRRPASAARRVRRRTRRRRRSRRRRRRRRLRRGPTPDGDSYAVAGITLDPVRVAGCVAETSRPSVLAGSSRGPRPRPCLPRRWRCVRRTRRSSSSSARTLSGGCARTKCWISEAYRREAREPIRNKARFNSALQEALNGVERRDGGFVPPAVQQRGKSGGHANGGGKTSGEDERRRRLGTSSSGARPRGWTPRRDARGR